MTLSRDVSHVIKPDIDKNMKLLQFAQIALIALSFSACSIGVAESRSARDESKVEYDSTEIQTNKKTAAKVALTNAVCSNPAKPCQHRGKEFAEWELSFRLPAKIVANKTYFSAPFYAVLLKTYKPEDCSDGEYMKAVEKERKKLQNTQRRNKVFAFFSCPNMDVVGYEFEGSWDERRERVLNPNFLAVYAGEREEAAEQLRNRMLVKYPKAKVKRMVANWERIEQ
jgi:hypothetical protein